MKNLLLMVISAVTLIGCTWVQLTSEGESVSLLSADRTGNCERIGRATAQTLGSIVTVERGGQRLQTELLTLARNEAGRMGGNTVVPESLIDNGQQDYGVYICPR
ncbi:MAG: hypothetical protein DHS20C12_13300 [Pseudohongiella sp.]|nr:MAG: hypothetical protein DHS20C12_13300 [Pseudohongiella sp.]